MPAHSNHRAARVREPVWDASSESIKLRALESIRDNFHKLHHGDGPERDQAVGLLIKYCDILPKEERDLRELIVEALSDFVSNPSTTSILCQVRALRYLLQNHFESGAQSVIEIAVRPDIGAVASLGVSDIFELDRSGSVKATQLNGRSSIRFLELVKLAPVSQQLAVSDLLLRYEDPLTKQHELAPRGVKLLSELVESLDPDVREQACSLRERHKFVIQNIARPTSNGKRRS